MGGARTALYNWLFARNMGGSFILRIEDTDLSRSTDENIDQIISSMRWLGLDWDEGPGKDGNFGPYRQMERLEMYQRAADLLLDQGAAYRCYCSPEEIAAERDRAKAAGKAYIYSGRCSGLSEAEQNACLKQGRQPVIRLKAPATGNTIVKDIIRGDVVFDNALIGDIILVRSSGVPTYNFAVSVDDSSMKISHVIRGDDHLPNTPKQLLILKALAKEPPVYAHLPLILGSDRAPLSKRHGASSVEEFRAKGFIREALCNYLALLGWSYDAETTLFDTDDLAQKFSLDRVGGNAAVFDMDKLLWMNGHYIRAMKPDELAARVDEFITGTELAALARKPGNPSIRSLIPLVQEKMKTLADFISLTDFFFLDFAFEEKAAKKLKSDEAAPEILSRIAGLLADVDPFTPASIEEAVRAESDLSQIKLGKLLQPVRIAVSGKTVTPGMFETLSVLGKQKSIDRITAAIGFAQKG